MSEIKITPLGAHILVLPEPEQTQTVSGIMIASSGSKEKPQQGKVVKLGTGGTDKNGKEIKFSVKVGDKVVFKKYSPDEIEHEGETYLIMEEGDVLAVIA